MEALKGRLCELEKFEKSIEEVHLLFIRLQTLIVDQVSCLLWKTMQNVLKKYIYFLYKGSTIQRIENHFNNARDYTEIAAEELKQAEELKNSNRSVCC